MTTTRTSRCPCPPAQRLKRVVCFVDAAHFVHGTLLGYLWCFTRLLIRGPSGRKRFNVLGAIDAVTHELTTVTNETTIAPDPAIGALGIQAAEPREVIHGPPPTT